MQHLTHKSHTFSALRSKLQPEGNLVLSRRNGPIAELGLRSYSASMETDSPRTALETICLWQVLVDSSWAVDDTDTDAEVGDLLHRADAGETSAVLLLAVLGMISLVMSGHLLAAAGSAEATAGTTIALVNVGLIVKSLLARAEGRQTLADAIKRDAEVGELVELPRERRDFTHNTMLRSGVRHGWKPAGSGRAKTAAEQEADKLTTVREQLRTAVDHLRDLIDLREANGTTDRLAWTEGEVSFAHIEDTAEAPRLISEPKPGGR